MFKINSTGQIIIADLSFVEAHYPGDYTEIVEPPAPMPTVRRLSKLAYMNRFTDAELAGIYGAAKTVVSVEVWLAKFNATTPEADGTSIDLDDPRTVAGLQGMEAAGLLGAGRAAEILA
jgi:hypothetical protein